MARETIWQKRDQREIVSEVTLTQTVSTYKEGTEKDERHKVSIR